MHIFWAPEQTANPFPMVTLIHALCALCLYGDLEIEAGTTGKTAVAYFIMN